MLERTLLPGTRLEWAKPQDIASMPKDGAIIESSFAGAVPIRFRGRDDLFAKSPAPRRTTVAPMPPPASYVWLNYVHGRTAKVSPTRDVLTGFMSGCLITTWTEGDRRWVGHLGTVESSPTISASVRNTFADQMPDHTRGYNPFKAWDPGEIANFAMKARVEFANTSGTGFNLATTQGMPQILSLVTQAGEFYSLVLLQPNTAQPTLWVVVGSKRVPPMDVTALRAGLYGGRPRAARATPPVPTFG